MMKIRVERFNGPAEIVEVEQFDAAGIAMQMNSSNVVGISIGDQVFSRIDIKHVKVMKEEETQ